MTEDANGARLIDTGQAERRRSDFYRAFGEFVLKFSDVEKDVLEVLYILSKTSSAVATSIFSGVHIDTAKDFINRIIAAEASRGATTDYTLLKDALDHLGHITRVRNDVLHHGVEFWADDDPLTHNRLRANTPEKVREYRVPVTDLQNMIHDLRKISDHITLQLPLPPGFVILPHVVASTRAPWRYRPPSQDAPPKKNRGTNPNRPPRRAPSQE
jgi:hypothetical protein